MSHLHDEAISAFAQSDVALFLGPRPGKKTLNALKDLSLTHCCTLLSEREGAPAISSICGKIGCEWIWLPLEGGRVDVLREADLAGLVQILLDAIAATPQPRIYFHCSAGIHRTGFFAYVLLRLRGLERNVALGELAALRAVTAEQVGDERIDLADEMVAQLFASSSA